ncbi:MAG TPA: ATP-binding protein [Spirochaetota bacterium]|nr:ATP-binding protein [Spirochaetota bacterium]HPI88073.1 ATP-binding protein [Spirochaetota bacterium]HPR46442.1 ATP-binding protein [Spirochaetota bacterium]
MTDKKKLILPNKFRDPYTFEEIIDLYDKIVCETDFLDLSKITFIEPYSMLSFLLQGRMYLRKKGKKLILVNIPLNINQYLARMDFFKTGVFETREILSDKMQFKRSSFSKSILEIVEIPNKERESVKVITKVIELFRKRSSFILKHWMTENLIDYFVTVISELCQNIFEHSFDSGFLSMQTYSLGTEKIVRLVISDSGIGIIQSFKDNKKVIYDLAADLLKMALTTPISSKRDFGYGLCQVNTIVERLKGMLFIRSENASLSALYNNKGRSGSYLFLKNDLSYLNGTQISISLTTT